MAVTFDDLQAPDASAGNDDLPPSFYGQSDTAPPPPASTSNAVTFDDLQAPAGPIATNTVNGLDYNSPSLESQPTPPPPPLAGPVQAGAQAAENAWNEGPIINTPATERLMQDVGIYRTPGAGPQPASAITESVARPLITAGDWALRGIGAGFRGAQAGVAQLGTDLGYPALGRDIAALPEAFAGSPDFAGIPREPVPPGGPIAPYAHVPEGMAPWESRAVQPGVPLPEGFAVPGAAPPPEPPPAPAGPVPGGPAPAAPAGGGAAVEPPVAGPRLPEGGTVEEVPVVQPDSSVILEQVLTQTQQPPPAAPENAPSPAAGEPPPQVAPTVAPEPAVAAAPGAGASLPPPRSPATIMEQDGVGGPQAIRRANAERAAYLAATGQEPPRDQRGELEAILADPRSNQEIQDELDAPKIAALQQTTDNLPHGFSIQQQGDDWVLTDPAGVEQMRVAARLPSEGASAQMGQTAAQLASTVDYSAHNRIGDGSAAAPVIPHQPSDVAAAAQQAAEPSPAQAQAGNYRMGHVDIGGLKVSIETPMGATRSGVDPSGQPWSVQMPADYGYIRRTEGADGDHVDVYLGPEAHLAPTLPVYVVDQKDAHSWQFDEHKAMIGFPSLEAAQTAYREGFSDGLGPQRMGAITPMTFEQFKGWLANGDTTKPVAYQPPPVMTPQKRRAVFNRPMSLLEFLAASGGVRDDRGELAHIGLTKKFIPKLGRLVRKNGMHLDRARELAQEAGYLPAESDNGPPQIGINELLKLMAEEAAGRKVFTPEDEAEMLAAEQARQQEVEKARFEEARQAVTEFATNAGMNLNPAEISEASISVMGGRDVRDAVADVCLHAALEADAAAAEVAEEGSDWDIPFDWETDPNVEPGEFPGVATASESSEPTGTGDEPAGHASESGLQSEGGNGPVPATAGGRPEAVPGHGERPATGAAEPEFDILNPVTGRERAEARGRRPLQGGNAPADNGLFSAAASGQTDLVEAVKAARNFGSIAAPNVPKLAQEFARRFIGGERFATIQQARKVASALLDGPVQPGTIAAKAIDEAVELGAVLAAREIVAKGSEPFPSGYVTPPGVIFDRLVQLYEEQQPKLGTRTSDSIERQAYSTPLPLAYLASRLAGVAQSGSVFEPTAGNGALLIEATPYKAFPNEIDPTRLAGLQAQGFKVSDFNAAQIPTFARAFDTLIANPPFGVVKDEQGATIRYPLDFIQPGYDTGEIDHAISLFSLETMKDDGTSVLILGGLNKLLRTPGARADGYNAKAKREFFFTLYGHYNVVDHFTVPGELYEKQGAGWPVDVIVIRGRGKSKLPLPSVAAPRIVGSWSALKEVLDVSIHGAGPGQTLAAAGNAGGVGSAEQPGGNQHPAPQERPEGRQPVQAGLSQHPGGQGGVANQPSGQPGGGPTPSGGGAGAAGRVERPQPVREPVGRSEANAGGQPGVAGSANVRSEPAQEPVAGSASASGGQGGAGHEPGGVDRGNVQGPERPATGVEGAPGFPDLINSEDRNEAKDLAAPPPDPQDQAPTPKKKPKVEAPTTPQVPYEPRSKAKPVGTLVPTNLRTATQEALQQLEERVGPVDAFVAEKLGYKPEQLGEYFSAEQVDAIALGIQNIDSGAGFIIGDQTGVGKGRFVAAMIRYADRQGLTPVFVTEKPNLYIDMVRDLTDIGMADFVDAILPTNSGLRLPLTEDPNGAVMRTADGKAQDSILREAADTRKLPEGKRALFTTYSQQQQIKETDTTRMRLLRSLAPNAFVILDEAHNAGGTGAQDEDRQKAGKTTRSKHFREVVQAARSVAYSSATWAKRPDVLDLYGAKTSMREAVDSLPELAAAVKKGGVPMQQIITAQLAAVGQYARRERSFDGVSYELKPVEVDRKAYDQIAGVLADIFRISEDYAKPAVKEISKTIRAEAKAMAGADGAIGAAGATSTGFGAIMHNLINQMLLASKAQATVDRALEKLKEGKKPVIALANTMGSFIAEFAEQTGVSPGQPIDLTFNNLLARYLERTLRYTTKKPFSAEKGEVHWLKPSDLGSTGEAMYRRTMERIRALDLSSLPVSPIDYMRAELSKRGYKVAEITGRTEAADYRADGKVYYRQRPEKEIGVKGRLAAIRAFNKGELDAMILNQSGATGLSLHASERNPPAGQAKRAMLIAQAEGNIDTHMQMLGRVHRTGQVIAPEYEQLVANVPAEQRLAAVLAAKMASLTASTTSARKNMLSADAAPDFMNKYGGQVIEAILMEDAELNRALGGLAGDEEVDGETLARKATGRIPLLPLKQQEEVYKRIEERYRRLLEELDAAGENALEAKTLDLDAKPLESKTLTEGNGSSPFSSPSHLERMDVKRTTKPPAPHQVVHMVAGGMDVDKTLPAPEELQKETNAALATRISRMNAGRGDEMVESALGKIAAAADAEREKAETLFKDPDAKKRHMQKVEANRDRLSAVARVAQPGAVISVTPASEMLPISAIVIGLHQSGKNAVAPSAWDVSILTEDGIRRTIPASQLYTDENRPQSAAPEGARVLSSNPMQPQHFLDRLAERGRSGREERWLITGNILAGFAKKAGQIINFTDAEGEVRQGVMMARDFDAAGFLSTQSQPLRGELGTAFLQQRYGDKPPFLTSSNGALRIAQDTKGGYVISVPQSKKEGAAFYLDRPLQRALGSGFVSSSGQMRARFTGAELPDVMEAIEKVLHDEGTYLVSDHPEAKKFAEANRTVASSAKIQGWDAVETQPETITPAAFKVLAESVAAMTGDRVHIRYVDGEIRLADPQAPNGYHKAFGISSGAVLITVALGTPPGTAWTLNHEAVHSLRSFGLIETPEWKALERAADQQGWAIKYHVRDHYRGQPQDVQREEAIAEAFADFMANRQPTPAGMIGRAVQRSKRFLGRLQSGLQGQGFTRPEDVFERIASGKVGQREAKPVPGRIAADLPSAIKAEILNGYSFHPKEMGQTLVDLAQTGEVDRDIAVEVAKSFAALVASGNPPAPQPNTIAIAGGVANTIITHLTNFERIVGEMVEPKAHPSPMAHPGTSDEARELAKSFANARRWIRWATNREIDRLAREFTPQQRERMWEAADAESVALQTGNSPAGVGLDTLSPDERSTVERLQLLAQVAFRQAKAVGIVRQDADEIPSYVPRTVINIGRQDEQTKIVRDIRTLALAISQVQEAVIGRKLINNIKEIGARSGSGQPTVKEGYSVWRPLDPLLGITTSTARTLHRKHLTAEETEAAARQIPDQEDDGFFTIPQSRAFYTWRWAGKNEDGEDEFERVPVRVRKDFEGALRAVLRGPDRRIYRAILDLKGRMMTTIMYGVAHLAVIAGRALPYSPNVLRLRREGSIVRDDEQIMKRAVSHGMVPIGQRFGFQDAEGLDPYRELRPGRSWTAQIVGALPSVFSRSAGDATKRAVDKAGHILHTRMLWDQVANIQAGSFVKFERDFIKMGLGPYEAAELAAHFANRVGGALPQEAMASWVQKSANLLLFSRSYRIGNLGMVKDAVKGLPRDMQARLLKVLTEAEMKKVNRKAKNFAISVLVADLMLFHLGNSMLQSAAAVLRGDHTVPQEIHGYIDRFEREMKHLEGGPLSALNVFGVLKSLTPMADNEPGKSDRILVGYEKDGTGIYLRNPFGKAIEDTADYFTQPLRTVGTMLSPFVRALVPVVTAIADGGVARDGRDNIVWDPYMQTPGDVVGALGDYAQYVLGSVTPEMALQSGYNIATGHGRWGGMMEGAKIVGGGLGFSLSHGYPGGPARGEIHQMQAQHQFEVDKAFPQITQMIRNNNIKGATELMTKLGMRPQQMRGIIFQAKQPHTTVRQLQQIMRYAPPDQVQQLQERLQGDREHQRAR